MNKRLLVLLIILLLVIIAIPLTLFVINQQQDIRSNADEPSDFIVNNTSTTLTPTLPITPTTSIAPTAACTLPSQVTNVKMEYPANVGGTSYDFTKAGCSWAAVSGSTSYSIKITQVESSSVIKTDTVSGTTTSYSFTVTPNYTYRCEISAVNGCGTGPAGSDQLLCETDTIPTTAPTTTVAPTVAPTTVAGAACGSPCTNGTTCAAGLTCVTAANSTRYCAITAYQNACALNPSTTSCCTAPAAPTSAPTVVIPTALPPTGITTTTIWLGLGGIAITIVGGLLLLL